MRAITDTALAVISRGAHYAVRVRITPPGDESITMEHAPGWSVSEAGPVAGTRLSVQGLQLTPTDGVDDLFAFAGYPGAVYDIAIGIDLGSSIEYITVFTGKAVEGSCRRERLGVSVSLSDDWAWCDRVPFTTALATTVDTRSNLIADLFTEVLPSLVVTSTATGDSVYQSGVYTANRGQAATQLATDGRLQVGFNADGHLIIKAQPVLSGALDLDWSFTANDSGTIIRGSLERTRPWADSLVNAVAVIPGGSWQVWTAQVAKLADTSDPRHQNFVGLRGVEITSETLANSVDAMNMAKYELTRRLRGTSERVRLDVLLNPAIEADDVFYVTAPAIFDDAGWNGTYIATSVSHSPSAGKTSLEGVSAAGFNIGA